MRRLITAFGIAIAMLWTANAASAAILSPITLDAGGTLSGSGGNNFVAGGTFSDTANLYLLGAPNFSIDITASSSVNGKSGIPDLLVRLYDPLSSLIASGTASSAGNVYFSIISNAIGSFTGPSPATPYQIVLSGTNGDEGGSYQFSVAASVVPIPGAALLFGSGLAALGFAGRFNRRKVKAEDEVAA